MEASLSKGGVSHIGKKHGQFRAAIPGKEDCRIMGFRKKCTWDKKFKQIAPLSGQVLIGL